MIVVWMAARAPTERHPSDASECVCPPATRKTTTRPAPGPVWSGQSLLRSHRGSLRHMHRSTRGFGVWTVWDEGEEEQQRQQRRITQPQCTLHTQHGLGGKQQMWRDLVRCTLSSPSRFVSLGCQPGSGSWACASQCLFSCERRYC